MQCQHIDSFFYETVGFKLWVLGLQTGLSNLVEDTKLNSTSECLNKKISATKEFL